MNIKQRNIVTCIILSFVTCGIYGIYWLICLARDAVSVKDASDNGLLEIVLMLVLPCVGFFLAERKFYEGCCEKYEAGTFKDNSILYLILGLFGLGIVSACMLQNDLNYVAG